MSARSDERYGAGYEAEQTDPAAPNRGDARVNKMNTRTNRCAFLAGTATLAVTPRAPSDAQQHLAPWDIPPLKEAFKGKFLIGTALNYPALQGKAPMDVAIATTHFSAITPRNSLKPAFTQPEEG